MAPSVDEIKLEEIDFDKVKECRDKKVLKKYIQLLEDDGSYFVDLLKATREKLLEVAPKDYYLLYPKVASEDEVAEAMRDVLEWEVQVKETDAALKKSRSAARKDLIWDDEVSKVRAPIRGQEPTVARPNIQKRGEEPQRHADPTQPRDNYARDKTRMKDYYAAWDNIDVDAMEEEVDQEMREEEESRRRHFEDMREQQQEAHATTPVEVGNLPDGVPEAHRKHLADSEKEKGNEAFYARDYEEAEAYYSRSIHFRPDDPSTWANRALVRLKREKPQAALQDCERALEINPRYMKALHRQGKALHELRRYEEAVRSFQLALAESPGNTQINGDLMLSRRHLREPSSAAPAPPPRVRDPSRTVVEEICDEEERPSPAEPSAPAAGYTRVMIEESDSEEEEDEELAGAGGGTGAAGAGAGASKGFTKVNIVDVSGSESEEEPVGAAGCAGTAATGAGASKGFTKVKIVDVSGSESEEEGEGAPPASASAAPVGSGARFAPPPRGSAAAAAAPAAAAPAAAPASAAESAAAGGEAVCFDDMD